MDRHGRPPVNLCRDESILHYNAFRHFKSVHLVLHRAIPSRQGNRIWNLDARHSGTSRSPEAAE